MLSVLNLMILRLDVDSVEGFADFGSAGANPGAGDEAWNVYPMVGGWGTIGTPMQIL